MSKTFFLLGSIFSFLAVALGAFGAHALRQKLTPEALQTFDIGVRYQMYHAFGLFVVAWVLHSWNVSAAAASGWWFTPRASSSFPAACTLLHSAEQAGSG